MSADMFLPMDQDVLRLARDHFRHRGYAVIPAAFDPARIAAEVDWAIAAGCRSGFRIETDALAVSAAYVPMTTSETLASVSLTLSGARLAHRLLERSVVPFRAKGTVYSQETSWHRDTDLDISAVSLLAYLDPLDADTGALRVMPGSHRSSIAQGEENAAMVLRTRPGDLILLDERVRHSSTGGSTRRQWRADYVAVPRTMEEIAILKAYVEDTFCPGWDGGYDVDRFPAYGRGLLDALDPDSVAVLRDCGALAAAEREEDFIRVARV